MAKSYLLIRGLPVRKTRMLLRGQKKEKTYFAYDEALKSLCADENIPYVQTTREMLHWYQNYTDTTQWLSDGVHPTQTGNKVYAKAALEGFVNDEDFGFEKQKAIGNFVYKLEILSRAAGPDTLPRVFLRRFYVQPAALEIYGDVKNRSTYNKASDLLEPYEDDRGLVNFADDFPFVITFSQFPRL